MQQQPLPVQASLELVLQFASLQYFSNAKRVIERNEVPGINRKSRTVRIMKCIVKNETFVNVDMLHEYQMLYKTKEGRGLGENSIV